MTGDSASGRYGLQPAWHNASGDPGSLLRNDSNAKWKMENGKCKMGEPALRDTGAFSGARWPQKVPLFPAPDPPFGILHCKLLTLH